MILYDDQDKELVEKYKWHVHKTGYAYSAQCYRDTGIWYMHRLIMGNPEGLVINHINHIKSDNRRENLEIVTHQENIRKMEKQAGVSWDENRGKWIAQITHNGKNNFLGRYDDYTEALNVRKEAEKRMWDDV
jgi:hypothetical protein